VPGPLLSFQLISIQEMLEDDPAGVIDVLKRRLREPHVRANRHGQAFLQSKAVRSEQIK
jgi:hypothetical protein